MTASSNFLIPNATLIVEIVAFLIVLGFLAKYVLPVLNKALEERQEQIGSAARGGRDGAHRGRRSEPPAPGDARRGPSPGARNRRHRQQGGGADQCPGRGAGTSRVRPPGGQGRSRDRRGAPAGRGRGELEGRGARDLGRPPGHRSGDRRGQPSGPDRRGRGRLAWIGGDHVDLTAGPAGPSAVLWSWRIEAIDRTGLNERRRKSSVHHSLRGYTTALLADVAQGRGRGADRRGHQRRRASGVADQRPRRGPHRLRGADIRPQGRARGSALLAGQPHRAQDHLRAVETGAGRGVPYGAPRALRAGSTHARPGSRRVPRRRADRESDGMARLRGGVLRSRIRRGDRDLGARTRSRTSCSASPVWWSRARPCAASCPTRRCRSTTGSRSSTTCSTVRSGPRHCGSSARPSQGGCATSRPLSTGSPNKPLGPEAGASPVSTRVSRSTPTSSGSWPRPLSASARHPVELQVMAAPDILGGAVIHIGDLLVDASAQRRLDQVEEHLLSLEGATRGAQT